MTERYSLAEIRSWGKGGSHEHFDCSIEPEFILRRGLELGIKLPAPFGNDWRAAGRNSLAQAAVAQAFQKHVSHAARASLENYLHAIGSYVLPVLQTQDDLYDRAITRFQRAHDDGLLWLKLRFAPQLHRQQGLTLSQVMEPMVQAVHDSPIPAKLVVCALRHENGRLGQHLANLCIAHSDVVSNFDLAGGESGNPGVLEWWAKQAVRVREATNGRTQPSIHLWETNEPTTEDLRRLRKYGIHELAHGIRGLAQGKMFCTVCVTSNIVTGQTQNAAQHQIDDMFTQGKRVCVDTDGTLFTMTDYTNEYKLLVDTFGWGPQQFLRCNLNALKISGFSKEEKRALKDKLLKTYPTALDRLQA